MNYSPALLSADCNESAQPCEVYDAPPTPWMLADWAAKVSSCNNGIAWLLIC